MAANAQVMLIMFRQGSGFSQLDSMVAAREYLQTAIAHMKNRYKSGSCIGRAEHAMLRG